MTLKCSSIPWDLAANCDYIILHTLPICKMASNITDAMKVLNCTALHYYTKQRCILVHTSVYGTRQGVYEPPAMLHPLGTQAKRDEKSSTKISKLLSAL